MATERASEPTGEIALVLSGGGARAAYQTLRRAAQAGGLHHRLAGDPAHPRKPRFSASRSRLRMANDIAAATRAMQLAVNRRLLMT